MFEKASNKALEKSQLLFQLLDDDIKKNFCFASPKGIFLLFVAARLPVIHLETYVIVFGDALNNSGVLMTYRQL